MKVHFESSFEKTCEKSEIGYKIHNQLFIGGRKFEL
jgi:hypothetical protein